MQVLLLRVCGADIHPPATSCVLPIPPQPGFNIHLARWLPAVSVQARQTSPGVLRGGQYMYVQYARSSISRCAAPDLVAPFSCAGHGLSVGAPGGVRPGREPASQTGLDCRLCLHGADSHGWRWAPQTTSCPIGGGVRGCRPAKLALRSAVQQRSPSYQTAGTRRPPAFPCNRRTHIAPISKPSFSSATGRGSLSPTAGNITSPSCVCLAGAYIPCTHSVRSTHTHIRRQEGRQTDRQAAGKKQEKTPARPPEQRRPTEHSHRPASSRDRLACAGT